MDANHNEYIISGGQEGKERLNVLSDVLYKTTRSLLETHGLTTGKSFLDLGCGGGNVSVMAAQLTDRSGKVTAIDFDASIISLAAQEAAANGYQNITFSAASAYDIDYSNEFDIAYARFLLSHLTRPAAVLHKMLAATKPGGKVIVEDIQFNGHFCYPACEAFDKYVALYTACAQHNGQNAEIGPSLISLYRQTGITNVGFDVIQPAFSNGAGKWMAYITMDKIKQTVKEYGFASEKEIAEILRALKEFTEDEQTIISLPRIFRVWGIK